MKSPRKQHMTRFGWSFVSIALGHVADYLKVNGISRRSGSISVVSKGLRESLIEGKLLDRLSKDPRMIEHLPDTLKHYMEEKPFILTLMRKNGLALEYVSDVFRADKEVVLAAVCQNGWALEFATDYQTNRDVVLAAVRQNGRALQHAMPRLKANKTFVLEAVLANGNAFHHAGSYKEDQEVVAAAMHWEKTEALRRLDLTGRHNFNEKKVDKLIGKALAENNIFDAVLSPTVRKLLREIKLLDANSATRYDPAAVLELIEKILILKNIEDKIKDPFFATQCSNVVDCVPCGNKVTIKELLLLYGCTVPPLYAIKNVFPYCASTLSEPEWILLTGLCEFFCTEAAADVEIPFNPQFKKICSDIKEFRHNTALSAIYFLLVSGAVLLVHPSISVTAVVTAATSLTFRIVLASGDEYMFQRLLASGDEGDSEERRIQIAKLRARGLGLTPREVALMIRIGQVARKSEAAVPQEMEGRDKARGVSRHLL